MQVLAGLIHSIIVKHIALTVYCLICECNAIVILYSANRIGLSLTQGLVVNRLTRELT